jgi:hypothetical protein
MHRICEFNLFMDTGLTQPIVDYISNYNRNITIWDGATWIFNC